MTPNLIVGNMDPLRLSKMYNMTAEQVEQEFPELWQRCYPRRYEITGKTQYDTPKAVARAMMDALLNYHAISDRRVGQTEQNEALWASTMVRYGVPDYYLSHDVAVALMQTTPAEVLDCMTIKLPFEAAAFMIPKGVFTHDEYGPISFVAYTRNYQNSVILCPHPNPKVKHDLHCMNNSMSIFMRSVSGMMLHWTYSHDINMIDLKDESELIELQKTYSHTSRNGIKSQEFTPADILAMTRSIKLLFNIILLMTHKPETVEHGSLLKRIRKHDRQIEYWSPRIIGRTYKLRYEQHTATGTHASPRGHWVSGFWREQPHGPGRTLRKTLWIEPFWRGGSIE